MMFFILLAQTIALSILILITDNANKNCLPLAIDGGCVCHPIKQPVICPIRYQRPLTSEDMN